MNSYDEFVSSKLKPSRKVLDDLTESKVNLAHCAAGLTGEAGEVGDMIKKHVFTGKELSMQDIIKELGDVEFYLQGLRSELGLTRDQIIQTNVLKLEARYKGGYSDAAASAKADELQGA